MSYFDQYTTEEIAQIVKQSTSLKDFARKIGYSHSPSGDTIKMLTKKLENFDTSHFAIFSVRKNLNDEEIFIKDSTVAQSVLRTRYLKNKYTDYKCSICGQLPVWQGKDLTLILDHINGINNDDRLENLRWVCPNCNQQLETTGSRNPQRKHFAKKYYCVDCGKEISSKSTRCLECAAKSRIISLDEMEISREELKSLIRTTPFTQIGKKYHVTDNAIKKWCDKYNLPRKRCDIKKYSDEEWSKL